MTKQQTPAATPKDTECIISIATKLLAMTVATATVAVVVVVAQMIGYNHH